MGQKPFVIAPWQQLAAVGGGCRLQGNKLFGAGALGRAGNGRLKAGYIHGGRAVVAPVDCPFAKVQVRRSVGQPVAQGMEQLAQVGLRLAVGCLRPEEEGDPLARLGDAAVEEQIGQERLQPRWFETTYGLACHCKREFAK